MGTREDRVRRGKGHCTRNQIHQCMRLSQQWGKRKGSNRLIDNKLISVNDDNFSFFLLSLGYFKINISFSFLVSIIIVVERIPKHFIALCQTASPIASLALSLFTSQFPCIRRWYTKPSTQLKRVLNLTVAP